MKSLIYSFAIIFFESLFISNIFCHERELLYKYTATRKFQLAPDYTIITLTSEGKLYLKETEIPNTYVAALVDSIEVNLYRDSCKAFQSSSCETWKAEHGIHIAKPFLIVLDCYKQLKYVRVTKNEDLLTQNFKLLIASMLQYNYMQIIKTPEPLPNVIKERTYYGECDVAYNVTKRTSSDCVDNFIHKHYDTKTCTKIDSPAAKEDDKLLKHVCNCESKSEFQWIMNSDMHVEKSKYASVIKSFRTDQQISYKPLKNSSTKINVSIEIIFSQIALTNLLDNTTIPQFNYFDTIKMQEMIYPRVNQSIITANYEGLLRDVKRFYESLSCEARNLNGEMGMIAIAFNCLEKSNQLKQQIFEND